MNRRETVLALLVLGSSRIAHAQQVAKAYRVGFVSALAASTNSTRAAAFQQGLRQFGYGEKNMTIEARYADGDLDKVRAAVIELVRLKADVIVTGGSSATRIAREVTSTIPIVMAGDNDPVGMQFVKSLAHPGGNVTGVISLSRELVGKQLELLKAVIPRLAHVAVLWNPLEPGVQQSLRDTQSAAKVLGMQVQLLEQRRPEDLGPAFEAAKLGHAQALVVLQDFVSSRNAPLLAKLADQTRIPTIFWVSTFVDAGGLLAYGVNRDDLARRAAGYVDKILKGARPADLPIEQPTKFDLVINKRTAKALGLTIPQSLLISADRVIE